MPTDADTSSPYGSLVSVACGAPGSCSAVGEYAAAGGDVRPLATSRADGAWSAGVGLEPAGDASGTPVASLTAIACGGAGSCAAVGFYRDDSGGDLPLVATQANGGWSAAVPIDLPDDAATASPDATLFSVACGGAGSCVAVGVYRDATDAYRPMAVAQTAGTWAPAVAIAIPTDAQAGLLSVDCGAADACVAGGTSTNAAGTRAIVASLSGAGWTPAAVLQAPADADATDPAASVDAIACGGAGSCAAAGTYTDAGGVPRTMVASQIGGSWPAASRLQLPADADPDSAASETSLACGAAGACVLAASYIDASSAQRPMVAAQANGTWSPARPLALPANAHGNPDALVTSVSCGAAWSCTAGGFYTDASGSRRAMLATAAPDGPTPPPVPPSPPTATAPSAGSPSTAPARPTILLKSSTLVVAKGTIRIKLSCRSARCSGTVKLTTKAKGKTVVLAKAPYAVAPGKTRTVAMRLTKAGRKAFRHARARAVRAKLVISVKGGPSTSRTVAVR